MFSRSALVLALALLVSSTTAWCPAKPFARPTKLQPLRVGGLGLDAFDSVFEDGTEEDSILAEECIAVPRKSHHLERLDALDDLPFEACDTTN